MRLVKTNTYSKEGDRLNKFLDSNLFNREFVLRRHKFVISKMLYDHRA